MDGRCGGAGRRRVSWWRRADDAHVGGCATFARQARPCEMAVYMSCWQCWIDCSRFASVTLPKCYTDRGEHSRQASRPVHMGLGAKGPAVSHVSCTPQLVHIPVPRATVRGCMPLEPLLRRSRKRSVTRGFRTSQTDKKPGRTAAMAARRLAIVGPPCMCMLGAANGGA